MKSGTAKTLASTYNRMQWAGEECLLKEVIDEAGAKYEKVLGSIKVEDQYCRNIIFK